MLSRQVVDFLFEFFQRCFQHIQLVCLGIGQFQEPSLQELQLAVVPGVQDGHLAGEFKFVEVEQLFHHLGAVGVAQLQKLLETALGNDHRAFEVVVFQTDDRFQLFDLDGLPRLVYPGVGIALQRGDVVKFLAIAATFHRGHVGVVVRSSLEDKLDEQLIRFEVHHVVVLVVFLVQPLDFTVKGEGDGFQNG